MKYTRLKYSTLALAIASSFTGGAAYAAESKNADKDLEVIEIRGFRASAKENLNQKRFANSIVDAITAEDIGKFPDKNVAESLSRITGVAVSREFGEGEKISIRGAGPDWNRTLLNGQTVASADWFILDPATRSFNYTLLPSSIVRGLEVYKSPQANIDEGSIGGTVILRTRKPLEMDANTINFGIQGQYSDSSGKTDPQIDGLYSWKNEQENFGFLINLVSQDRSVERQGLEVLGWNNGVPTHIGVPTFLQDRERKTLFSSIEFAPTESLDLTLNILNSKMESNNQNANLLVRPADHAEQLASGGGNILSGTVTDGWIGYNFINRISETETSSVHLEVTYDAASFTMTADLGVTEAEGGTLRETSWEYATRTDYSYDLTGKPRVDTEIDTADGSNFAAGWIWGGNKPTFDEEKYAQIDFEIPVEFGFFTDLKTGLKVREAEREVRRTAFSWHGPGTLPDGAIAGWNVYLQHVFNSCPTLAACGLDALGTTNADVLAGGDLAVQVAHNREVMEAVAFEGVNGLSADYAQSTFLAEEFVVGEDIFAAYVQGDFEGDNYRGNMGLRYVSTDQTSGGWDFSGDSFGFKTFDREWLTPARLAWVEVENDYTELLPSFNLTYNLDQDTLLRFGLARVMARQNWTDISSSESYGSLNQAQPTGTRNNPLLKPTIADQIDVSYEWYYADASLFAVTAFYKDLDSLRTYDVISAPRFNEETEEFVDVNFSQPVNDKGASIAGIEVSLQHDFDGYGVQFNYTYTNADSDQVRDEDRPGSGLMNGTSEHMLNFTGYYENNGFAARLMYNYRTEWYKGLHFNGNELWNDDYGQWDAVMSYNVTDNITINVEAINLTDEEIVEYNTDRARIMSLYANGRRLSVGARFNF